MKGVTLTEVLVVMILTGILFLLLFDGVTIVNTYGRLVYKKLGFQVELLDGHQTLELLLEKADSIIRQDEGELLLFRPQAGATRILTDGTNLVLYRDSSSTDTIFTGLSAVRFHLQSEERQSVDSIFLSLPAGRDTLQLEYGLPPAAGFTLNNSIFNHDAEQ